MEEIKIRGISQFFLWAIPAVLALAALWWLAFGEGLHYFRRELSQERRHAIVVGAMKSFTFVAFLLVMTGMGFGQAGIIEVCDFRLQSCIREGELFSTTWGGSAPNVCYTRVGDSLIPDPCSGKQRHVEPSAEYTKGMPACCREFPEESKSHITSGLLPEPIDVPAITTHEWVTASDIQMKSLERDGELGQELYKKACLEGHYQYSAEKKACLKTYHSCKDKKRILEHDEDTPPIFWCHKVQP